MSVSSRSFRYVMMAAVLVLANSGLARAQSSTRGRMLSSGNVALNGYCPVCIINMKKWVKGNPQLQTVYDGKTYRFPSEDARQAFLADPAKFVPAMGGDCTVCYAKMNKRMPGSVYHAAYHENRLYLFPGDEQKQMFVADPTQFANVDLALNGNCAVCLKEMQKEMAGKPEIAAFYQGFRYLFPGEDQRQMFLQNPAKYAVGAAPASRSSSLRAPEDASERSLVRFTGKSGCAGCDFGVHPLGSDELGLAVKSADGRIFIVEDAHKLYPDIYRSRFDGLNLDVQGQVLKTDGQFTWVKPTKLAKS